MAGNTFGTIFRFTSFGESHGKVIGGVIDGCPAGISLDLESILRDMERRRPGRRTASKRKESDIPRFLSGLLDDTTTGAPIAFVIPNEDAKSDDYEYLKDLYRPSHGDFTYHKKYGLDDHRLVHRASARETAVRVVAGAIAKQLLGRSGIFVAGITSCIGPHAIERDYSFEEMELAAITSMQCPDKELSRKMKSFLTATRKEGDSIGCEVQVMITGVPAGIGDPIFNKLQASMASAMLSINAAVSFDFGSGRHAAGMKGSEYNDLFTVHNGHIRTSTNNSGGIQAGISNGEDINFRVVFKPIPTISKIQQTVDRHGNPATIKGRGRHDVCVAPRVVSVVEAMGAMVILDHMLLSKVSSL
ncbi:MAG: chorismate synthase [Bacteroidetes bacterium]|nr:MAG: chorismate synthase [Bacteroidota bacterium]